MHTYQNNSPQAAARIVALTMLVDGHLCRSELDVMARMSAHVQLGLQPDELHEIVRTLCADLHAVSPLTWEPSGLAPATLAAILMEIDDPQLRAKLFDICVAVTAADKHMAEGEKVMLAAASELWELSLNPTTVGQRNSETGAAHV